MVQKQRFGFQARKKHHPRDFSIVCLLILITTIVIPGNVTHAEGIIYVDHTATGSDNGSSWENAFTDLQAALSAAVVGDEIWVATGIYTPGSHPEDSFQIHSGIEVYGGFDGTEENWIERDWQTNLTILSGDISGDDSTDASGVVIDPAGIMGTNAYHVVTASNVVASAFLDGFVITAGKANGDAYVDKLGGGAYFEQSNPTLSNLRFTGNTAMEEGGGIFNSISSPSIDHVIFYHNAARLGGGTSNSSSGPIFTQVNFIGNTATGGWGGAMSNQFSSNPSLTDVTLEGNQAKYGGGMFNSDSDPVLLRVNFVTNSSTWFGGGMENTNGSEPSLTEVIFDQNTALYYGGAIYNELDSSISISNASFISNQAMDVNNGKGGGIYTIGSALHLIDGHFTENIARSGGALYNENATSSMVSVSEFGINSATLGGAIYNYNSSPGIEDSLFNLNNATLGGGIYNSAGSSPTIHRSRFLYNFAENSGGGLYNLANSDPELVNVVMYHNIANYGGAINNINSSPSVINTTFSVNIAGQNGGGIRNEGLSEPVISNSILWNNSAGVSGASIYNLPGAHLPTISFSDIQGSFIEGIWDPLLGINAGHNIDADPLLDDSTLGDLFIGAGSPAIDAGSRYALPPGVTTDLLGNYRIFGLDVDMGPYELGDSLQTFLPMLAR